MANKEFYRISEVSKITGITVSKLHYYEKHGLIKYAQKTASGRIRLYNYQTIEQIFLIILYKRLDFKLEEIKEMLYSKDYDLNNQFDQQLKLLSAKRLQIDRMINCIKAIRTCGIDSFSFDTLDAHEEKATTFVDTIFDELYENEAMISVAFNPDEIINKIDPEKLIDDIAELDSLKTTDVKSAEVSNIVKRWYDFLRNNTMISADLWNETIKKTEFKDGFVEVLEKMQGILDRDTIEFIKKSCTYWFEKFVEIDD